MAGFEGYPCLSNSCQTWLLPYLEDFSHLALLREGAVVLYGQDDGHVGYDKRGTVNGFHHILEDQGRDEFLLKNPLITNEKSIKLRRIRH